ncbi:class I SAM-dependent methyltransferase [Candidatus Magnetaquicoccus inordinatus]|uniref:class I SAM-dependent methyltransferase n=1 Tax=Candidatus Magnetaquicoccus inordinatus TaxID=2496818 RepID=UPI00102AA1E8|nr:class I SAM-dependent methyltransferase [Candidatus Magnetaquicoccus inordinatus]
MNALAPHCRLCAAEGLQPFAREQRHGLNYTIVYCRRCRAVQTLEHHDPISPDYIDLHPSALDANHLWCQSEHKQAAFRQWQTITGNLWPDEPRQLLDVGCATGGFLQFAAHLGWQPYGFDASAVQAAHAQKSFPQVRQALNCRDYLQQLAKPPSSFAMITLWDVLEHIRDPHRVMGELHALLAEGGLLFFSLPNSGALFWKRFLYRLSGRPFSLDPWEHVFYYAPITLRTMLPEWGFRVERIGSVVCYPRPWSLFELQRRIGFALLNRLPTMAPQIYCLARKVSNGKSR